jgi:hypothetical protein
MSDAPLPGPLEDFLREPPGLPAAGPLRAAILARTTGVLRRRRRRRRALLVAGAAAAAVLAGLALHAGLHTGGGQPPAPPTPVAGRPRPAPRPAARPGPAQGPPAAAPAPKTPLEEEWAAFDAVPHDRARLYFQTGDRYLNECQDVESALRCYRQALRLCAARDLAFDPNDNWLVMALKQGRRKER